MPFIPTPPGVVRVRTIWSFTGLATAENVSYFDIGTGVAPTSADLGGVATAFETAWGIPTKTGKPLEHLATDIAITELQLEDASSATGPYLHVSESASGGQVGGTSVPPGVAGVVTLYTAQRGRSHRGRIFFPGLPEDRVGPSGDITSTAYSDMTTAFDNWLSALVNPSPFTAGGIVVASFHSGVDPVTKKPIPRTLAVITPINSVLLRGHVHSQRRRNIRD